MTTSESGRVQMCKVRVLLTVLQVRHAGSWKTSLRTPAFNDADMTDRGPMKPFDNLPIRTLCVVVFEFSSSAGGASLTLSSVETVTARGKPSSFNAFPLFYKSVRRKSQDRTRNKDAAEAAKGAAEGTRSPDVLQPRPVTTAAMDRVRSAFNNLTQSERYSRFTLQPAEDGERHVEVKLSDDDAATHDGEVEGRAGDSPTFRLAPPHHSRRNMCYLALGGLLVLVTGYLVGYVSHRKAEPVNASLETENPPPPPPEATFRPFAPPAPELPLSWMDITQLLTQKLTRQAFDETLRGFDRPGRSAGSAEDVDLATRVYEEFKKLEMDPWSDNHYVQLQKPDSNRPNRVLFGSDVFEPAGYLAYSAPGKVQGKLVYGNYGRREDLEVLQTKNVELRDSVLLLRSGKITFAEQVDNAEAKGASAVLIYPDVQDYKYDGDTALYGHVHLGSGDPYTPGFPSFNHTQFPPAQSSGLPKIPAQTITANMASALLQKIGGPESDAGSGFRGGFASASYRLGGVEEVTVEVNNSLVNTKIRNVFGVIKGVTDPDRYVVLGAQRDAWGRGYARATVGTSVLVELARAVSDMVKEDRFRPKRSLVFASWSAGEYGNIGATEWLEGYMSSIDKSVFTYISLDGLVMGRGSLMVSASPLLYSLVETTMKKVKSPLGSGTVYDMVGESNWEANVLKPMTMDDPAYTFVAFSGIPSVSFHFISPNVSLKQFTSGHY
ncbi:hypothetical protein F2P81_019557 [Scophthalmus maximus]|uniref:Transferrin receptor protein 1 n=1 Tax=Scophthalmus maximus TaxID=52904 RepID=A0A6A4S9Z9_SCOMX|nr:hypothetical protein F2P81_019557 [Scophthalmus maximus]